MNKDNNVNDESLLDFPWESGACDECIYCADEDICTGYHLGLSYGYCPQIRNCGRYKLRAKEECGMIGNQTR